MLFFMVNFHSEDTEGVGEAKLSPLVRTDAPQVLCPVERGEDSISFSAAVENMAALKCVLEKWRAKAGLEGSFGSPREIGACEFSESLQEGFSLMGGNNAQAILALLHVTELTQTLSTMAIKEDILDRPFSKSQALKECANLLCDGLEDELGRIFTPRPVWESGGHPVHYSLLGDDPNVLDREIALLCGSLYTAGRLESKRITRIDLYSRPLREEFICAIYRLHRGGTVVVELRSCEEAAEHASSIDMTIDAIMRCAAEYRHSVLTVFTAKPEDAKLVEDAEALDLTMRFLKLQSSRVDMAEAKRHLVRLAKEKGCKNCRSLVSQLDEKKQSYSREELTMLFNLWYDKRLRAEVYPAYSFVDAAPAVIKSTGQTGTAYEELRELIGLEDAKRVIGQAVDYARAQRIYSAHGFAASRPNLHMAFTGNPGTAKTTVARLTAQIFRDNGLLPRGELIEVGREDLVAKYVGWTARLVDEKFARARGSMLFIDEAYSLLDGERETFGAEAVNSIVQHMENDRNDTVVVFAGYSEPMERFSSSNAGLRSRVAFHVDFPDYSEDELMRILKMMLDQRERAMTLEGEDAARAVLRRAMHREDFGNGRFVRTLAEQAMLSQATRIVRLPQRQVTAESIRLLLPEDFRITDSRDSSGAVKIGFAS